MKFKKFRKFCFQNQGVKRFRCTHICTYEYIDTHPHYSSYENLKHFPTSKLVNSELPSNLRLFIRNAFLESLSIYFKLSLCTS